MNTQVGIGAELFLSLFLPAIHTRRSSDLAWPGVIFLFIYVCFLILKLSEFSPWWCLCGKVPVFLWHALNIKYFHINYNPLIIFKWFILTCSGNTLSSAGSWTRAAWVESWEIATFYWTLDKQDRTRVLSSVVPLNPGSWSCSLRSCIKLLFEELWYVHVVLISRGWDYNWVLAGRHGVVSQTKAVGDLAWKWSVLWSGSDSASLEALGLSAPCPACLSHLQRVLHVWTFRFNSAQANPDGFNSARSNPRKNVSDCFRVWVHSRRKRFRPEKNPCQTLSCFISLSQKISNCTL